MPRRPCRASPARRFSWASGTTGRLAPPTATSRALFANIALEDVPSEYNVVAVAFMKGRGIPTFQPYNLSDAEFRRQVGVLNAQGRAVLISLGAPTRTSSCTPGRSRRWPPRSSVWWKPTVSTAWTSTSSRAPSTWPTTSGCCRRPSLVREHYAGQGKHFIVSMAPEFPYLHKNGKYVPYLQALEGVYDFIAPQYYNQGGDGLWVQEANGGKGAWIAQNNDAMKEDFLYYLTESLATGSRDFVRIPAQRLAIGLPSNVDAAATGYVIDPAAVSNAFRRLEAAGHAIKGLMTWSVNWDDGLNKRGERYNWEFRKRYASLIHDGEGGDQRPAAPQGLRLLERGETSLVLAWNASSGQRPIDYYSLYRDGAMVGQSAALGSTDSGLTADTRYSYFVTATDTQGNQSLPSEGLEVSTSGGAVDPQFPQWRENQAYRVDDGVTYEGLRYLCLQAHTSNSGWTPPVAFTLWRPLR